jgi:dTDP-4-dehydrorhamnose 3,5-epimerase
MTIQTTPFKDLLLIQPTVFRDDRGYFFEPFNEARFRLETGLNITFVQDNESMSNAGVLRGMHFQLPPKAQAKLIRVTRGRVLDVVVDLRRNQPTFMQYFAYELNEENKTQMFVPEGFAHGFVVLEDYTIFSYKCSNYYSKEHDRSLSFKDPVVGIEWGITDPIISEKDQLARAFSTFDSPFF